MKPAREIKYFFLIFLFISGLFICGCKEKDEPEDINELAEVYVELTVAREQYAAAEDSTKLATAEDSIFAKFGYTEEEYNGAIKGMEASNEVWDDFFNYANKYLDSLKAKNR